MLSEEHLTHVREQTESKDIQRVICGKLGHKFDIFVQKDGVQCRERGVGQYSDPCYGMTCSICPEGGYVDECYCSYCNEKRDF